MSRARAVVPLHLEHDRPFVPVTAGRRRALFWADTGGGSLLLSEPLARDLGLRPGPELADAGRRLAPVRPPLIRVGEVPLSLDGVPAYVVLGRRTVLPGTTAEGLLPGCLLSRYRVAFDYPGRSFELAAPDAGAAPAHHRALAATVHATSGFVRVTADIDGQAHGMLLDTGASFSMLADPIVTALAERHPDWSRVRGAFGRANMVGGPLDRDALLLRLDRLGVGPFALSGIGVVSRPEGVFERGLAPLVTAPVAGALAGNVLRRFRVEIDYAGGAVHLRPGPQPAAKEHMDMVGLVLRPEDDGFVVEATCGSAAARAGDRLLEVDGLSVRGLTLAAAVESLRGLPGEERAVTVQRSGTTLHMRLPVTPII